MSLTSWPPSPSGTCHVCMRFTIQVDASVQVPLEDNTRAPRPTPVKNRVHVKHGNRASQGWLENKLLFSQNIHISPSSLVKDRARMCALHPSLTTTCALPFQTPPRQGPLPHRPLDMSTAWGCKEVAADVMTAQPLPWLPAFP